MRAALAQARISLRLPLEEVVGTVKVATFYELPSDWVCASRAALPGIHSSPPRIVEPHAVVLLRGQRAIEPCWPR